MKNFTLSAKYTFASVCMFLITGWAFAQTYTATSSGNWDDSNTWQGGTAPTYSIGGLESVEIPDGITVTLDNTVVVDGLFAGLDVEGALTTSDDGSVVLTSGSISGDGDISLDDVILNGGSFPFTGNLDVNSLTVDVSISNDADITIHEKFTLSSGTFSIAGNGNFQLDTDGQIVINGGNLALSGGGYGLSNPYDVMYMQGSSSSGFEMDGPGLRDLTIDVGQANAVTFNSDIDLDGVLTLESGTMILNGNDLMVNGSISSNGDGAIQSTDESDIAFHSTSGASGILRFTATGNEVDNFTIDIGDDNWLSLNSDLIIHGNLNFTSGGLNADDNDVSIMQSGAIMGADSTSYVMTSDGGTLSMYVSSGGNSFTLFHVGTADYYMPAAIQLTSESSAAMMRVGVDEGVMSGGTSGIDWAMDSAVVNGTWYIEPEASATDVEANIRLMWNEELEVNSFDRQNAYLGHYTAGDWEMAGNTMDAVEMNGLWYVQANNVDTFSPFAVFSSSESSSIDENNMTLSMQLYPNPSTDRINLQFQENINGIVSMEIVDVNGRVMLNGKLTGNNPSVDIRSLSAGTYFIRLYGAGISGMEQFIKQ